LPEDARIRALPTIPPIVGCEAEKFLKAGSNAWIVGFGATGANGAGFGTLRQVEVKINRVSASVLDVGDAVRGACHGDSGGPLYVQLKDGDRDYGWRIAGATSGPGGPCDCACSTVYVNIGMHVAAIEKNEGIDVTPCTDATGAWNPGPECKEMQKEPASATGTFPGCVVARTTNAVESCGPNVASGGAGGGTAMGGNSSSGGAGAPTGGSSVGGRGGMSGGGNGGSSGGGSSSGGSSSGGSSSGGSSSGGSSSATAGGSGGSGGNGAAGSSGSGGNTGAGTGGDASVGGNSTAGMSGSGGSSGGAGGINTSSTGGVALSGGSMGMSMAGNNPSIAGRASIAGAPSATDGDEPGCNCAVAPGRPNDSNLGASAALVLAFALLRRHRDRALHHARTSTPQRSSAALARAKTRGP
jgi:MYXO-CTERM domain-containing protein